MKRLFILAALLGALGTTAVALAAGGSPITEKILGAASISHPYTIDVTKPADVIDAQATVPPGASFGWHYHRAAVVVVVKSGTLTLYDSADRTCTPQRYSRRPGLHRTRSTTSISPETKAATRPSCSSPTSASSTASTPTCRPQAPGTAPSSHSGRAS